MKPFIASALVAALVFPLHSMAQAADDAILRATVAVENATPRTQADPTHPVFHITSPAQWMNDPNGPIYYKGFYHLFYQLNPYSDTDGLKYWGHVRSRDLVKWEPLPIAIAPSNNRGEAAVWSGCCTINGLGQPMIFYTSIGSEKSAFDQAEQWAAIGDNDLIHWHKLPSNPVLPQAVNGATKIYDWRDPFVFHDGNGVFLVTGGHLARQGRAAVNIYEAENPGLTQWKYRGPLFELPDPGAPTVECPNFFQLDGQWALFVSPYGRVQYFIGDFDAKTCRFTARRNGLLDYGSSFYAPNTLLAPAGRRLVWGWLHGFPPGHGWNGCLSLPRQLSLAPDGALRQSPAPELSRLRGAGVAWRNVRFSADARPFPLPATNTLEIQADIHLETANRVLLNLNEGAHDAGSALMKYQDSQLTVMDIIAPLALPRNRKLELRIFIDRSVLEVFANDMVCVTRIVPPAHGGSVLFISADGGGASGWIRAWPIKSIW